MRHGADVASERLVVTLCVKYFGFAVLAIMANLLVQRAVFATWQAGETFVVAIALGTVVGLVVKYWLDARWIFYSDRPRSDLGQFGRYTITGVVTTFLFWGFEWVGWYLSGDHQIRELAAIIGLSLGYLLKYQLDKRFVFAGMTNGESG